MIEYELEFTQDALDDIQRHKKSGNKPPAQEIGETAGGTKAASHNGHRTD